MFVHQQVVAYFTTNSFLSPGQFCFRDNHSTQDLLLKVVDDWMLALDNNNSVGIAFIDPSKAFKSTDHSVLCTKLSAYGFDSISLQ